MLTLDQRKILLLVLERMFPNSIDEFRTFLKDALGKNLDEIAIGPLRTLRSKVIDDAETYEWTIRLREEV